MNAQTNKRIFLICRECAHEIVLHRKHRETLAKLMGKKPENIDLDDVRRNVGRFRCKKCSQRAVHAVEENRSEFKVRYVAAERDANEHRKFHRDTCGWVGHIHKARMIEFLTREHATMAGYDACKVCRP